MVLQTDESAGALESGDVFDLLGQFGQVGLDNLPAVDPDAALGAGAPDAQGLPSPAFFVARSLGGCTA